MPVLTKTCLHCGKGFSTKDKRRKYCTHRCACLHKTKPKDIRCRVCGKERQGTHNLTIEKQRNYRCLSCAKKDYWKDRKHPDTITCMHCGEKFPYRSSGKGPCKFCSPECRLEHKTVLKICPVCDKEYRVSKSTADRYAVCSVECKTKETVYKTCKRCGQVFTAERKRPRHYCSEECRRPPHIIECAWCGKKVRRTPSDVTSSEIHFCDFACYRKYSGNGNESGLEKRVRLALEHAGIAHEKEYAVGKYVFDFYLPAAHLLLEADGDYWHSQPSAQLRDQRKTARARKVGFAVERLQESTIMNDSSNVWLETLIRQYPDLGQTGDFIPLQPMLPLEYPA